MRAALAALAVLLILALPASGQGTQPHGLLWNRSGLPAVFPLQIKTDPGRDYYIVLRNADTGDDALAAYIVGGRFFRVLVPPGTYALHFASGTGWEGERGLFGPGAATRTFRLPDPLTFEVRGLRTKSGYFVDLRDDPITEATLRPLAFCQILTLDPDSLRQPLPDFPDANPPDEPRRFAVPRIQVRQKLCS